MLLIADAGSTKTAWSLLTRSGHSQDFQTEGINPFFQSENDIVSIVSNQLLPQIGRHLWIGPITHIYFYGAGCTPEKSVQVKNALQQCFKKSEIEVDSDMVGAALALFGKQSGVACILGTGSNSCLFIDGRIKFQVPSLGFILGDEGGAAALGKQFVADFIKDLVPDGIARAFRERFDGDYAAIVRNVYREGTPAKYFGSIAPLLTENASDPYVNRLIVNNFRSFIERSLLQYDRLPVGVVGGFGYACRDILRSLGPQYGITWSKFIASPMEGLIDYYGL